MSSTANQESTILWDLTIVRIDFDCRKSVRGVVTRTPLHFSKLLDIGIDNLYICDINEFIRGLEYVTNPEDDTWP
jgi:hypothetical protein